MNMITTNLILAAGVIFILGLLGVLILIPTERKQKIKHKKEKEPVLDQKNWQDTALRLEKHIQHLHNEITVKERGEKQKDKQLLVEQEKVKRLQEKILQERQWHDKEESEINRKAKELEDLRDELKNVQGQLVKEHADNLKMDNSLKEIKVDIDKLNDLRRLAEAESAQLKAKAESYQKEISQLRIENRELSRKKEDTQWIAKSEYSQLEKQLKEVQKELEKLKTKLKNEAL